PLPYHRADWLAACHSRYDKHDRNALVHPGLERVALLPGRASQISVPAARMPLPATPTLPDGARPPLSIVLNDSRSSGQTCLAGACAAPGLAVPLQGLFVQLL